MRLTEYRFWFDAILDNNDIEMERILSEASTWMVDMLVNGNFEFECINSGTHPVVKQILGMYAIVVYHNKGLTNNVGGDEQRIHDDFFFSR